MGTNMRSVPQAEGSDISCVSGTYITHAWPLPAQATQSQACPSELGVRVPKPQPLPSRPSTRLQWTGVGTAARTPGADSITVGALPHGLAVTPDGSKVYVANKGEDTVSVIETATRTVIRNPLTFGFEPLHLAISPQGDYVYITNSGTGRIAVLDAATNSVVDLVDVGAAPVAVAVAPDGTQVYVTVDNLPSTVAVIDVATRSVTKWIEVDGAWGVCVAPDSSEIYVASYTSPTVSVISAATQTFLKKRGRSTVVFRVLSRILVSVDRGRCQGWP